MVDLVVKVHLMDKHHQDLLEQELRVDITKEMDNLIKLVQEEVQLEEQHFIQEIIDQKQDLEVVQEQVVMQGDLEVRMLLLKMN